MRTLVAVLLVVVICVVRTLGQSPTAAGSATGSTTSASSRAPSGSSATSGSGSSSKSPSAATTARSTTPARSYIYCYACGGAYPACLDPISRYPSTIVQASSKWCQKTVVSVSGTDIETVTRSAAPLNTCQYNGCTSNSFGNVKTVTCCCSRDYCNGAINIGISAPMLTIMMLVSLFLLPKC